MKRSIVLSSTASGAIPCKLAQRAKRDKPWPIHWSVSASSRRQAWSSSTPAVLSIGRKPAASMAAARSLRKFDHLLRDTLAQAGTMPSSTRRISLRSSAMILFYESIPDIA
jgi:hypothetical protein